MEPELIEKTPAPYTSGLFDLNTTVGARTDLPAGAGTATCTTSCPDCG